MSTLAVLLKKIAVVLMTDKRTRTVILSVIVGFALLIFLLFGFIFSLFSFGSKHNTDLIYYIFYPEVPIENLLESEPQYYYHIKMAREHLAEIKTSGEEITRQSPVADSTVELIDRDILRAQVVYYVLFLERDTIMSLPDKPSFVGCFYNHNQDGETVTAITDDSVIYRNIESLTGCFITEAEKKNISEILLMLDVVSALRGFPGEYSPPIEPEHMNSISSRFGYRKDPLTGETSFHNGTDFSWTGCYGANIYAVASGVVTRAGDAGDGFGRCVIIDHGGGILTYYAHCASVAVHVGDNVSKGQYISKIGSTGRSTGPHLHFGLKVNGVWQDAMNLFQ